MFLEDISREAVSGIQAWILFWVWSLSLIPVGALFFRSSPQVISRWAGITALVQLAGALYLLWGIYSGTGIRWQWQWFTAGTFQVNFGLWMDGVSGGLLVLLYLLGAASLWWARYTQIEIKHPRTLYGIIPLFIWSMAGVLLAIDLVPLIFFWAALGICSSLLIARDRTQTAHGYSALVAKLMTKPADLLLVLAAVILILTFNTTHIPALTGWGSYSGLMGTAEQSSGYYAFSVLSTQGVLEPVQPAWVWALLAFCLWGAAWIKSGIYPFTWWLIRAMDGPGVVSALLHAATMVTAGVYLMFRFAPHLPLGVQEGLAVWAALSCVWCAWAALRSGHIKEILAWSTASHISLMYWALALGMGPLALLHLFTHAFFKWLLFALGTLWILKRAQTQPSLNPYHTAHGSTFGAPVWLSALLFIGLTSMAAWPLTSAGHSKDLLGMGFMAPGQGGWYPPIWAISGLLGLLYAFKLFLALRPSGTQTGLTLAPGIKLWPIGVTALACLVFWIHWPWAEMPWHGFWSRILGLGAGDFLPVYLDFYPSDWAGAWLRTWPWLLLLCGVVLIVSAGGHPGLRRVQKFGSKLTSTREKFTRRPLERFYQEFLWPGILLWSRKALRLELRLDRVNLGVKLGVNRIKAWVHTSETRVLDGINEKLGDQWSGLARAWAVLQNGSVQRYMAIGLLLMLLIFILAV